MDRKNLHSLIKISKVYGKLIRLHNKRYKMLLYVLIVYQCYHFFFTKISFVVVSNHDRLILSIEEIKNSEVKTLTLDSILVQEGNILLGDTIINDYSYCLIKTLQTSQASFDKKFRIELIYNENEVDINWSNQELDQVDTVSFIFTNKCEVHTSLKQNKNPINICPSISENSFKLYGNEVSITIPTQVEPYQLYTIPILGSITTLSSTEYQFSYSSYIKGNEFFSNTSQESPTLHPLLSEITIDHNTIKLTQKYSTSLLCAMTGRESYGIPLRAYFDKIWISSRYFLGIYIIFLLIPSALSGIGKNIGDKIYKSFSNERN